MHWRSPLLVGRDHELAEIATTLTRTRRSTGAAVVLVGEPGIGKTRLTAEAVRRASDLGMVVLHGRPSTTGPAVPFGALTEALLSLARAGGGDLVRQLGPYGSVLGRLIPDWAAGGAAGGDGSTIVLAEATLRLTALAGAGRGCLLVIDDLHEVDVETLAVIEYLIRNLRDQPVAVLLTVRGEPSPALDLVGAAARNGDARLVRLSGLDAEHVRRVVATALGISESGVPEPAADRICTDSAGNPLMVEELLTSMVDAGELVDAGDCWRFTGRSRPVVPATLAHLIAQRVQRLGPQGAQLLSIAAVLGVRFPLSVLRQVTGLDDRSLFGHLQAAVAAQLLTPDQRDADWYAFRHPLTAEALLSSVSPGDRVALAGEAADALAALHPDLPGELCNLAASLRRAAGERWAAAALYREAGRRALADGAPGSAIAVLGQALELLGPAAADDADRAEEYRALVEQLLFALAEAGQFDRAVDLAATLQRPGLPADPQRAIALHVRLAWAAQVAGRWTEGQQQVAAARAWLPPDAGEELTAPIDAVDAYLTMSGPAPDRARRSEELGLRAVAGAERIGDPSMACQALYAIGFVVRERDLTRSDACFDQMLAIAAEHRFTTWRTYALVGLGGNAWLRDADPTPLQAARDEALRTGGIGLACNAEAVLGLDLVLRGDFRQAGERLRTCLAESSRMKLVAVSRYVRMALVVLAAHLADRRALQSALADFRRDGGTDVPENELARGLGLAVHALLEEDRDGARRILDQVAASEARQQSPFHLAGTFGLTVLLDVLAGRADRAEVARARDTAAGSMRWNRQFTSLALVVLAGRDGDEDAVEAAMQQAAATAAPFPTAWPLGLRLVAGAAVEEGWGRPAPWLQEAEAHFHRARVGAVASACRTLLRRTGAPVRQRRSGVERIPDDLRVHGVTLREYEVLEMLALRLRNKPLAARLHISPRTVEKHVAALVAKLGVPDRDALVELAAERAGTDRP